jgi:hypothetical protein
MALLEWGNGLEILLHEPKVSLNEMKGTVLWKGQIYFKVLLHKI